VNVIGSFVCFCKDGFHLDNDSRTCVGMYSVTFSSGRGYGHRVHDTERILDEKSVLESEIASSQIFSVKKFGYTMYISFL
jgi:hypothetical protein